MPRIRLSFLIDLEDQGKRDIFLLVRQKHTCMRFLKNNDTCMYVTIDFITK